MIERLKRFTFRQNEFMRKNAPVNRELANGVQNHLQKRCALQQRITTTRPPQTL